MKSQKHGSLLYQYSDHIQIKKKMPNHGQVYLASSIFKSPNQDLKDIDILCTFKRNVHSQYLDHRFIKDQLQYSNQDQEAKLQPGTSSPQQSPILGLKGHGCSLDHRFIKDQLPCPNQY